MSFVANESRASSTRANPIIARRGAGFPLLMPDTFTERLKEASHAGCTLLTANVSQLTDSMRNPDKPVPAAF